MSLCCTIQVTRLEKKVLFNEGIYDSNNLFDKQTKNRFQRLADNELVVDSYLF